MEKLEKFCDRCADLDVVGGITALASLSDYEPTSVLPLESFWHQDLDAINQSAASCTLCALFMKGWRECREVIIEHSLIGEALTRATPLRIYTPTS